MKPLRPSSPNIVRDWGGQPYDKPLVRMREHVEVLKAALTGERVNYDGEKGKVLIVFHPVIVTEKATSIGEG